jgi:hypothetical protein
VSEKTCLTLLTRLPHLLGRYFHSRLSCFLFVHPAQALLNSSPQLLARDRRAVARSAELGPGDLRMDAAAYAAVSGRGSVNCRARVRGSASRKRAGHIRGNIPLEISGITITTNLAGVDRAKGDEVKSSTAMRVLAQSKKEPRLVNSKRGRKCGQGQNRTADTRIFSALAVPRLCVTIGRYWYLSKRLTVLPAGRFYRFEHIETYSSGKVVGKVKAPDVITLIGCPPPSQTSGRQISPSAETACRYSRRPWRTGGDC